jgi:hypothetical protein
MDMIMKIFSVQYYVEWVEVLTIIGILLLLGYVFYVLNIFKKE